MKRGSVRILGAIGAAMVLLPCLGLAFAPQPEPVAPTTTPVIRFTTVDVYVDSGDVPLAAYQLEFKGGFGDDRGGAVKLVGIEGRGGDGSRAFAAPPGYDPAALSNRRVVIADYSTLAADKLPRGKTRVARLHLMIETPAGGEGVHPEYAVTLIAAGSAEGAHIRATATVLEGEGR